MTRPLSLLLIAIAAIVQLNVHPASAQDASAVVERLKLKYDSIQSLSATFTHVLESDLLDSPESATGTLLLKGDQYKIQTDSHQMMTDGTSTWVLDVAENQLIISDNDEDETAFSVSEFFFRFDDKFTATDSRTETINGQRHSVLSLAPKDADSFLKSVVIHVRDSDNIITRITTTDINETIIVYSLDAIEINVDVSDDDFTLERNDNTDVVDLRY